MDYIPVQAILESHTRADDAPSQIKRVNDRVRQMILTGYVRSENV